MLGNVDPRQVKVSPWVPTVYAGRDNRVAAQFQQWNDTGRRDTPLDFSAATRFVLILPEVGAVFDTDQVPDVVDATEGQGVLVFDLSPYAVTEGTYRAQLVVYDDEHPNGQVVVSSLATHNELTLSFYDVQSTGVLPPPIPTPGTGDKTYPWHQEIALQVWTVPHNLGKRPAVSVTDDLGNEVVADVRYLSDDIVQITHGRPETGWAYFN